MSQPCDIKTINRASGAGVGIVLVGGLFAVLSLAVKLVLPVPAVDAARGQDLSKNLAELRAAEDTALTTPGWIDESKGIVRLLIDSAIQLTVQKWQNPAAARADLKTRAANAAAPSAPAPPKPSSFE